jgi:hypothetical protein
LETVKANERGAFSAREFAREPNGRFSRYEGDRAELSAHMRRVAGRRTRLMRLGRLLEEAIAAIDLGEAAPDR